MSRVGPSSRLKKKTTTKKNYVKKNMDSLCELVSNYKDKGGHRDGQVEQNRWKDIRRKLNECWTAARQE